MKGIGIIALIAMIAIPSSSFAWGPRSGGVVIRPFPGAIVGGHFGRVPGSFFVNRALLPPSLFFSPAFYGSYYRPSYAYPAYAYPPPYPYYYNNYYSVPPPASVDTSYERGYSQGYFRGYEEALREARHERYDEDANLGREQGEDDAKSRE